MKIKSFGEKFCSPKKCFIISIFRSSIIPKISQKKKNETKQNKYALKSHNNINVKLLIMCYVHQLKKGTSQPKKKKKISKNGTQLHS